MRLLRADFLFFGTFCIIIRMFIYTSLILLEIYIYIYEVCQKFLLPDVIFIIDLPEGLPETFRNLPECRF